MDPVGLSPVAELSRLLIAISALPGTAAATRSATAETAAAAAEASSNGSAEPSWTAAKTGGIRVL